MGMDLVALIRHDFNKEEAYRLPQMIDEWGEVKELFLKRHPEYETKSFFKEKSKWNSGIFEMTPNLLERIWNGLEIDDPENPLCNDIDTFFADISVYKNTISISPNPEHKYGNLTIPKSLDYLIDLIRLIAKRLNQFKIVYCADSYVSTSILWERAMQGATIEEIIEYGNDKFGVPPFEINEAIGNYYFFDKFDLNPSDFDPYKKVFDRCEFEYYEGQKNNKLSG
jgi:hypothetical protein